jgi:phage terminase large subunit GpA-like protein
VSENSEAFARLRRSVAAGLRPPARLSYSQWAAANFRLSAAGSGQAGKFRPWKFQREILDAMGDPAIERVSVMKSARTGFTKSLVAAIGATAINDPCAMALFVPTDDDAKRIAVDEIDPAFRESPALSGAMKTGRSGGRNTLTQRTMTGGGTLKVLSARSPRNFRSHTLKVVFCDEVDGMEITSEGDPLMLIEKRTLSFVDRKIVVGSTPTDEVSSLINKRYGESDQRVFEVPCPHCSHRFELQWEHIKWTPGKPSDIHAACPECGSCIDERDKPAMVEAGEWRAMAPEVVGHAGFRVSSLVSLFANASWAKLAEEYEKAVKSGPSATQVFYNTVLGRPWSTTIGYVSDGDLFQKVEDFGLGFDASASRWSVRIPSEVLYVTAGIDVQVDRLEVSLWGWSEDGQRWVLGHEIVRGSTKLETTWSDLDALLETKWKHPLGGEIGVEAACVDSGDGNRTQEVYDYCMPRSHRRIVAIKGRAGPLPVIKASTSRRKKSRGGQLWIVGVDQVKTDIITAVALERGTPGCIRFSDLLDREWFSQFASEQRKVRYIQNRPVVEFARIANRNAEALDASVYAIAARGLCRFDFERRMAELTTGKPKATLSIKDIAARFSGGING